MSEKLKKGLANVAKQNRTPCRGDVCATPANPTQGECEYGMEAIRKTARRLLLLLLGGAVVIGAVGMLSPEEWAAIGQNAALVAAGLQHPLEGAACFERQWRSYDEAGIQQAGKADTRIYADGSANDLSPEQETAATPIPPKGEGGGAVDEEQLGGGETVAGGICVKNNSGLNFDWQAMLEEGSPVSLSDTDEPQVLIVHTHTCESYMSYYAGYYNEDDETRSTDDSKNVVAVGEALAGELRAAGIGVVHDTTKHDYPAFSGAYERSEQTILSQLAAYPSIRVVIDLHRDAMMGDDLTKYKPTATVAGRKAAQVMLVLGATDTEDLPNSYCRENIRFGMQLQRYMNETYEGLMRPMYLVDARYNQGLLPGSLLIEVGTDANTLSEAVYAGQLVGKGLSHVLNK